jgi:hypothetical protein
LVYSFAWTGPRARSVGPHGAGFESHLTAAAGQQPLPMRQASPRMGLTLPPRWCHRRQARACSVSPAVPWTCPKHRSTAVIHGQQGSVRVPSELQDRSVGSGWRELPKLAVRPYSTSRPANAGTVADSMDPARADGPDPECPRCLHEMSARTLIDRGSIPPVQGVRPDMRSAPSGRLGALRYGRRSAFVSGRPVRCPPLPD